MLLAWYYFLRLLLLIFIISTLVCSIVIVLEESLVGRVFVGWHPLMKDVIHLIVDDLFDCIGAVAGTPGSCIVLAAIIISSCEDLGWKGKV